MSDPRGRARRAAAPAATSLRPPAGPRRILGIDPGSRVTGYGLVQSDGRRVQRLASGCIRVAAGTPAQGLAWIHREVAARLEQWAPDVVAVESVFTQRNMRSALVLGQARGAILAACGLAGIEVAEYAPAQIKSAVAGNGAADKAQVQKMVALLIGATERFAADEADALACALCHAQSMTLSAALASGGARRRTARRTLRNVLGDLAP